MSGHNTDSSNVLTFLSEFSIEFRDFVNVLFPESWVAVLSSIDDVLLEDSLWHLINCVCFLDHVLE